MLNSILLRKQKVKSRLLSGKKPLSFSLLIFFSLVSANLFAQKTSVIDSLQNVLKTAKEDTAKVNTLNLLSKQLNGIKSYENAMHYADSALLLAEKFQYHFGIAEANYNKGKCKIQTGNLSDGLKYYTAAARVFEKAGNQEGIARAYNAMGSVNQNQGNFREAIRVHSTALKISITIGDNNGMLSSYNYIGLAYARQGNFDDAIQNLNASLKINENLGNKFELGVSYSTLGLIFNTQGKYADALKHHFLALKIYEESGQKFGIASCYNNIALIYLSQDNQADALTNFQAALKVSEEIDSKGLMATAYSNIGIIYRKMYKEIDALINHEAALKIREKLGDKAGMASSNSHIGVILLDQKKFQEAMDKFQVSLKVGKEINDKERIAVSLINIGNVLSIQASSEKAPANKLKYDEALQYYMKGISAAQEIGHKEIIKEAYMNLSKSDSSQSNFAQALEHHKLYTIYKDSLLNEETNNQTAQLKIQYETEKKDKEIELLNKENDIKALAVKQKEALLLALRLEAVNKQNEIVILNTSNEVRELQLTEAERQIAYQQAEAKARAAELEVINKDKQLKEQQLEKQKLLRNGLIIGTLLIILPGVFIFRQRYRMREIKKMYRLRTKISSDLHDDIGSTLTSIRLLSEMAKQQTEGTLPQLSPLLEKIGSNAGGIIHDMSDIVWAINPKNDAFKALRERMENFASEIFSASGIQYSFSNNQALDKLKLSMEVRKNIFLIFKEAVNNAAKYSGCKKVEVDFMPAPEFLRMRIRDDGTGFDAEKKFSGNGLQNMRARAGEINGELKINSGHQQGVTIELKVPL